MKILVGSSHLDEGGVEADAAAVDGAFERGDDLRIESRDGK